MNKKGILLICICLLILSGSVFIGPKLINPLNFDELEKKIILSLRLPRVVVASLMGIGLGASGAVLQGMLRNPLADPYILGISSGASLVAVSVLVAGFDIFGLFTIPLFAFIGALFTGIIVGILGHKRGAIWPERLLLAGVGIGFLFSSIMMLIMSISRDEGLRRSILWIFGDLSISDWSLIPYGATFIIIGLFISFIRARALNTLMLGDEMAYSLGFSPSKERLILFLSVGLMTSASISLGGIVGFIGLLMPHLVRFFIGSDNRYLIPFSAMTGGTLLCIADTTGRTIISPAELPSGIITAIIGAPYFLYLLRRKEILGE